MNCDIGNARVQILDELGSCVHIIKNFNWFRDDRIGKELVVDQSGTGNVNNLILNITQYLILIF